MNFESREQLEERADEAKQRLLDKVDLLEQRKEVVVDTVRQVRAWVPPLTLGAVAATTVLGVVLVVQRRKRARKPRWALPARPPSPPTLLARLGRELLVSGVTMLGTHLLQLAIGRVLPQPPPSLQA